MKICFLGRADYILLGLRAKYYASQGHEVHIISLQKGEVAGCQVYTVSLPSFLKMPAAMRYGLALPKVYSLLQKIQPDIVDLHGASSYGIFAYLPLSMPVMTTIYGPDLYMHAVSSPLLKRVVTGCVNRSDMIYGSTPSIGTYIKDILGKDVSHKLTVRSWGIPTGELFKDVAQRRQALRDEFDLDSSTRVVLHNRHFTTFWRVQHIVEAAVKVVAAHPTTEFWFVYPPPNAEGEALIAEMKTAVVEWGIADNVRFLGPQNYERMISIMHAADIFVCVGEGDLLASSVLEALGAGLIPILVDLPAYHEVIDDGENGLYLEEINKDTIADAVIKVADDYAYYQERFSQHNIDLVRDNYDQASNSQWLLEQLEQLIQRGRSSHNGGAS